MKRCAKCGQLKESVQFYRYAKSKDGLQGYCKACHAEQNRLFLTGEYQREYRKRRRLEGRPVINLTRGRLVPLLVARVN